MSENLIRDVENALVGLLKDTGLFQIVQPYSGEVSDVLSVVRAWPAAYVAYVGSDLRADTAETYRRTLDFQVLLLAKDLRGGTKARQKTAGMYDLLEGTLRALAGKVGSDLSIDEVLIVHPTEDKPLLMERNRIVWSVLLEVQTVWR